jgi:single-stranded-DNA-specific exonuclease
MPRSCFLPVTGSGRDSLPGEQRVSLQTKRWHVAEPLTERRFALLPDLPPLVVQLLHNRGIREPGDVRSFLAARFVAGEPFQLKGMSQAVARLRQAIRAGERIAVYGDFDVDGVTATALLVQALAALGAQAEAYIPNRVDEGYGLNLRALRKLYRRGVRLVVTVDCGIRSMEEVKKASPHLDIIITDHHTPKDDLLPPAAAIVNPKQPGCSYPFKGLAGVGLAYKLAQALFLVAYRVDRPPDITEESLLDLVALGTVADLAPLLDENRMLVRRGLVRLNQVTRLGVEALMADANLRRGEVDATAIGFRLGPRLNAAGRIGSAMLAYRLLTGTDPLETRELAQQLGRLNEKRQALTEQTVAEAEAQIQAGDPDADLYLVASPRFEPGIVGLAASRLTDAYYRPSIVVEMGERFSRGSCRSISEFSIIRALDRCGSLMVRYGGHAAAAGFTVATERLGTLRSQLQAIAAEELAGVERRPLLKIDAEIPLEEVDWATLALLAEMEPCGAENPSPVLLSRGVEVRDRRPVGAEQKHLKLTLRDGRGVAWDAIYFRAGRLWDQVPARVDVAYTLGAREWNHEKRLQLLVEDLRPSDPGIYAL